MSVDCQKKNKGTSLPLVLEKLQNATVMEGERVVLRCRALNDPNATSRWIKRNSDSANVIKYSGTELAIENATVADTGIYICMVRNHIWLKLVDVWVTVKQTTTSLITTTTTTKPPTTTITTTTTTAGLQICYRYNLHSQITSEVQRKVHERKRNVSLVGQGIKYKSLFVNQSSLEPNTFRSLDDNGTTDINRHDAKDPMSVVVQCTYV